MRIGKKGLGALEELELKRKVNTAVSQSNESLADLRHIMSDHTGPEISSSELLKKLLRQNESECNRANQGMAITRKWLLKRLRPYEITAHLENQFNAYMLTYRTRLTATFPLYPQKRHIFHNLHSVEDVEVSVKKEHAALEC